jgi:SAM-dependent methyltransferase
VTGAGAGYITDVEYTATFNPHQAPAWLSYIAAINGYAAPRPDEPFAWCELGCGKGLTALLLAAMHPQGEFHACDLNPAHVHYAKRLQVSAAIPNLHLHEASIARMIERDLPRFDYITLHGVYSWVPDPVRDEIVAFARARLKPGGLLMVTYNAMPGWAHAQPIRQMMQAYAAAMPGGSLERARAAFGYVRFLVEQGAAYFRRLPAAAEHLEDMARRDIRYIAHEYLTPHGDPFYFAQVETRMRATGLSFAGSMSPADNYPELMAAPAFQALLGSAPSRLALETHRDFIANTSFRADLYAAQPQARAPAELPFERLDGLAFSLAGIPEELPMRREQGSLRFDLESRREAVQAVHQFLLRGPADARAVGATALVQQLVVAGHVAPCPARRAKAGWLPVNSALVEAALQERQVQVPLACPLAGTASQSEPVQAAAIEAAARFPDAESAARWVLAQLRTHQHPVNRHGADGPQRAAADDEVIEYAAAAWRSLRDPSSPEGRRLRLFGLLT